MVTVQGSQLPNFLYLGPDKAGSSWLHQALSQHPQVFLSPAKDLYFFDRFYDRGLSWYSDQFRGASPQHPVIGEISPDYLASPEAPKRIAAALPQARLMVTLRDPATRAFSSWLYMRKHGEGPKSFGSALDAVPDLLEHGRYGTQLARFREYFPADQLHIALFDDLTADPQAFLDALTQWLDIEPLVLSPETLQARLPASKARIAPVAWAVRRAAEAARSHDLADLVGRVKRSRLVHAVLYRPLGEDAPRLSDEDRDRVRAVLADEVLAVERDYGLQLRDRWGWPVP